MQLNLHPRRWHLLTWSAFVLWLLFAVVCNRPRDVTYESFSEVSDDPSNVSGPSTASISTTNSSITSNSASTPIESSSTGYASTVYSSTSTTSAAAYSSTLMIGWPFTYQEHTVTSTSGNVTTNTHWFWLMGNIVVLFIVQFCVAYSFQQFGQFSVKTMLLGTLLIALLILLGRFLSDTFSILGLYYYICAIYFSPAVFAVLKISAKWYSQRCLIAERRAVDDAFDPTP